MKIHTTNYFNTFIEVAEDCPLEEGQMPFSKVNKMTIAEQQFDMISKNPYSYSSDDVLFLIFAERKGLLNSELQEQRELFFSKGQACFRASPLSKRYGFGFHFNQDGKVAIFPKGSQEYHHFLKDSNTKKVKAMRSRKS